MSHGMFEVSDTRVMLRRRINHSIVSRKVGVLKAEFQLNGLL